MTTDPGPGAPDGARAGPVQRLVSGGQTGADQSIVAVGRRLGIPIGGLVPRGWRTERGPMPELGRLGFTESDSADYRDRTRRNVAHSDATLVFVVDADSDGSRLTLRHARAIGRPCLCLDPFAATAAAAVRRWLEDVRPRVLNIAGNRESRAPGIGRQVERVLYLALAREPERGGRA